MQLTIQKILVFWFCLLGFYVYFFKVVIIHVHWSAVKNVGIFYLNF